MTTVRVLLFGDGPVRTGDDPAAAVAQATRTGGWVWVQVTAPDPETLVALAATLGLSADAARDSIRHQPRTRLTHHGDDLLLVLQPATYDDAAEQVTRHEVDVLVGARAVLTVVADDAASATGLLEPVADAASAGPLDAVWALLERTAQGYREVLDGVENDVDEIEEQLFGDDPGVSRRIFGLQREVIGLAHATSPLPDVLTALHELLVERGAAGADVPLRDLHARARYAADRIAGLKHTLDNALEIHSSLVSQRLDEKMAELTQVQVRQNEQVKKISSWAAIGFAPTLVASVYGMNFRFMPELDQAWGYPFALGLMVAVSAGLYVVFRRNDWL